MSSRAILLLCALLATGCATPDTGAVSAQSPLTLSFLRVSREVPAFGGITRDHDTWIVFVLDAGQREGAEARLRDIFAEDAVTIAVRTRAARGLASEAMDDATGALSVPGIGAIDYDETTGYLEVGLFDVEALEPAQTQLDAAGISREQTLFAVRSRLIAL